MVEDLGRVGEELAVMFFPLALRPRLAGGIIDLKQQLAQSLQPPRHPPHRDVAQAEILQFLTANKGPLQQPQQDPRIRRPGRIGFYGGAVEQDLGKVVQPLRQNQRQLRVQDKVARGIGHGVDVFQNRRPAGHDFATTEQIQLHRRRVQQPIARFLITDRTQIAAQDQKHVDQLRLHARATLPQCQLVRRHRFPHTQAQGQRLRRLPALVGLPYLFLGLTDRLLIRFDAAQNLGVARQQRQGLVQHLLHFTVGSDPDQRLRPPVRFHRFGRHKCLLGENYPQRNFHLR